MILVQESFGQVVIPYGIAEANEVFNILNGLGLIFIPFGAAIVRSFFVARAQGADEGSPSILAIKMLEKSFYSMIAVMYLFFIPNDSASTDVRYNHYLCGVGIKDSYPYAALQKQGAIDTASISVVKGDPFLPLGFGIMNNLSVGTSESLSGALESCKSTAAVQAEIDKAYINIADEKLVQNLIWFNEQCFAPALKQIAEDVTTGSSTLADPYNRINNRFFGTNLLSTYNRNNLTLGIDEAEEYAGAIEDKYKTISFSITNDLEIDCSDAALDYRNLLKLYVNANLADQVDNIYQSTKIFPQNEDGVSTNVTKDAVLYDYIQQSFIDTIMGKRSLLEVTPAMVEQENRNWLEKTWDFVATTVSSAFSDTNTKAMGSVLAGFGFMGDLYQKSSERMSLYIVAPVFISIFLSITYVAAPLLILFSGYSWKFVYNLLFAQFYLVMVPYVLNIAFIITNIISMYASSFYGGLVSVETPSMALHYMAVIVPTISLVAWTTLCTLGGLNLGTFLSGFFMGHATAAGRQGAQMMGGLIKSTVMKGAKSLASKAGKSSGATGGGA